MNAVETRHKHEGLFFWQDRRRAQRGFHFAAQRGTSAPSKGRSPRTDDAELEARPQEDVVVRCRLRAVSGALQQRLDVRVLADDDVDARVTEVGARESLHFMPLDVQRQNVHMLCCGAREDIVKASAA